MKVWIQRDSLGKSFQMWGYREDKISYHPPPPSGFDIIQVIRTQTDTVYIPKAPVTGSR
jgi:hypothetical protein